MTNTGPSPALCLPVMIPDYTTKSTPEDHTGDYISLVVPPNFPTTGLTSLRFYDDTFHKNTPGGYVYQDFKLHELKQFVRILVFSEAKFQHNPLGVFHCPSYLLYNDKKLFDFAFSGKIAAIKMIVEHIDILER